MNSVLFGPSEYRFGDEGYARSYNYLRSLPDNVSIDAVVHETSDEYTFRNASLLPIEGESRLRYKYAAGRRIKEIVDEYDVFHYPYMNFPDYEPIIRAVARRDIPVVVGPCEAGHDVPPGAFQDYVESIVGNNVPRAVSDVGYSFFQSVKPLLDPIREWLFKWSLAGADTIVAVNEATKQVYQQYVDGDIDVIPYGVHLDKCEYANRADTKEILSVGNLIARKGYRYVLRAMPEVLSKIPDAHFHLVGTGPRREFLQELAVDLNIESSFTIHEYLPRDEFQKRFRSAQVFVHPSLSEGYSHIRLEAMASGCPVVGTDVRGAHEMIRDGVDGYVVERESMSALIEPLCKILSNPDQAKELGQNARERIEQRHDWNDIASQYISLYEQVRK
ncbi:12-diacylglycerol 3-glucosyltransferase protein [Halorhabdus tiamatea SARL4B]|uniref:12-diacylglycerol 3-glucosyltransferase protein n=1 Tax=Halorhabdus tiamatea SARL4B TaxID=1033806 RepID=F7PIP1_9EURY|nr:glycosyltransferase [Halorhabdus tiamatea]ERJ06991.1 12-diacylglycerol 3-glucosyltransferase protein [Halorhabdus tiamatea SARL4B]CCQ34763.1 glycosyltransferase [Halorhabdus tiamatea SARL4B]